MARSGWAKNSLRVVRQPAVNRQGEGAASNSAQQRNEKLYETHSLVERWGVQCHRAWACAHASQSRPRQNVHIPKTWTETSNRRAPDECHPSQRQMHRLCCAFDG